MIAAHFTRNNLRMIYRCREKETISVSVNCLNFNRLFSLYFLPKTRSIMQKCIIASESNCVIVIIIISFPLTGRRRALASLKNMRRNLSVRYSFASIINTHEIYLFSSLCTHVRHIIWEIYKSNEFTIFCSVSRWPLIERDILDSELSVIG